MAQAKTNVRVQIGGVEYTARIRNGVLRFQENKALRALVDRGALDLNIVALTCERACIPRRDVAEFWMMLGYTVDGFSDIFGDLEIVTPDWYRRGINYDGTAGTHVPPSIDTSEEAP